MSFKKIIDKLTFFSAFQKIQKNVLKNLRFFNDLEKYEIDFVARPKMPPSFPASKKKAIFPVPRSMFSEAFGFKRTSRSREEN